MNTRKTARPLAMCAACGGPTGKVVRADRPRRVCSFTCRRYLQHGQWQASTVGWRECLVCQRTQTVQSCAAGSTAYQTCSAQCTQAARLALAPTRAAIRNVECDRCGKTFTTNQPTHRFCSRACSRKHAKLVRRVREAGTYGEWRWSDFMRIASKFGYCCAYCGSKPERLDPDHVVPLSRGGSNTLTNLLPACLFCNSDKGTHILADWARSRAARGLPAVHTNWAAEDPRYWHLTEPALLAAA